MKTGLLLYTFYLFSGDPLSIDDSCAALASQFTRMDVAEDGDHGVRITWESLAGAEPACLSVERSSDAVCFEKIATQHADAGRTGFTSEWDTQPMPGYSYYRLARLVNDRRVYSGLRKIYVAPQTGISSAGFSDGTIYVRLVVPVDMPVDVRVMSITGEQVRGYRTGMVCGNNDVKIKADDLPSGIYFIKVLMGPEEYYRKVYVLNE